MDQILQPIADWAQNDLHDICDKSKQAISKAFVSYNNGDEDGFHNTMTIQRDETQQNINNSLGSINDKCRTLAEHNTEKIDGISDFDHRIMNFYVNNIGGRIQGFSEEALKNPSQNAGGVENLFSYLNGEIDDYFGSL